MDDPAALKAALRRALSTDDSVSSRALADLVAAAPAPPFPPTFFPPLLARALKLTDPAHLALAQRLLSAHLASAAASPAPLTQSLHAAAATLRASRVSPRHALTAVRVSAFLLLVPSPLSTDLRLPALQALLSALAALSRIAVPPHGPQPRAKRKADTAARRVAHRATAPHLKTLCASLQAAVDAYAKHPHEAVAAAGLLSAHAAGLDTAALNNLVASVAVAALKTPRLAPQFAACAAPALSSVDPDVLRNHVFPLVDRALVREPETALAASAALLSALPSSLDLSAAAAKSVFPAVLAGAKASNAAARAGAVELVSAIAPLLHDADAARDAVAKLVATVKTARYPYQRVVTARAVTAVATTAPCERSLLCDVALDGLHAWLASKKESNDEARVATYQAVLDILVASVIGNGNTDTPQPASKIAQKCASLLASALAGKPAEVDQRIVAQLLTEGERASKIGEAVLGEPTRTALEKLAAPASMKAKQELSLLALTVLCEWACADARSPFSADTLRFIADTKACPVFWAPVALESENIAICAIRCCVMLAQLRLDDDLWKSSLNSIFRLCVDARPKVAAAARRALGALRKDWPSETMAKVFMLFWKEHFTGVNGHASVARSYDFDDNMIGAEKLGRTLLTLVLPDVPKDHIPFVAIAANHPRLTSSYNRGRPAKCSRYWEAILPKLPEVDSTFSADEVDDWLDDCFRVIFGEDGLRSHDPFSARAASNALVALANEGNKFVTRVLRRTVQLLHPLALGSAELGVEAFEAIQLLKQAEEMRKKDSEKKSSATSIAKKSKKPTGASNARLNQERQAEADKARAAAASASVMAEKVEAAQALAKSAEAAIENSTQALQVIYRICEVAKESVYSLTASMLSLTLPLAKVEALESVCRDTVGAIAATTSKRLRPLAVDIATCLYGLERGYDVKERVTSTIFVLKDMLPPALSGEDFSLIAPIIRAALAREVDPSADGATSGRRGSSKRRDLVATTKAAAGVLLEHCKPEAIDAAVAASSCRAGSWIVRVLEREDGAFTTAADVLAHLTGTVISPATDALSQVLQGVLSGKSSVRDAALASLARIPPLSTPTISCPRDPTLGRTLWLARFDPDEANAELADELWCNYKHPLHPSDDVQILLGLIGHKEEDIRIMSSKSVALSLRGKEYESTRTACLSKMFSMYVNNLPGIKTQEESSKLGLKRGVPPPVKRGKDRNKSVGTEVPDDGWIVRDGVARTLENMAIVGALSPKDITFTFSFLAGRGLGDLNNDVRAKMARSATAVVQAAGTLGPAVLLPMIEKQLNTECPPSSTREEVMHADRTRENLVTCLGSVANFLPSADSRVREIANQVIKSAMETPSEVVQNAAARCVAPLAKAAFGGDREAELTKSLLDIVWSDKAGYGQRRGAAYAMAGLCSGIGLKFLRKEKIISQIETAVAEKNPLRRQGGFLLIETCAILMRGKFEPYVVVIVPFLLACMSDGVVEVRHACWAAAQAAMSELTSQGVKLVLPSLVEGLNDRQWRTKAGSAEVLGAMAFCAPRQLAQCLPQVVPKLAEALADAHPKVIDAAESAINRIAAVVRSPEVRKLSPFLLAALRDPAGRTAGAVDAMLGSEFVHAIDAASLALLIPPLHRGLRDRSSELKKRSAAIVGSMCNNVANHFDVVPYLDLLLPALRVTLLDAIPDVRRTSARALGALAVSLGEKGLPDIVPWLVTAVLGGGRSGMEATTERLKIGAATISSSAERSGAAMGLAEVAASMNERRLEEVLDRILIAGRSSAGAREGGLMFIAFLPRALGERFEGRIGTSLTAILQGLSDDSDSVREAALEAGRNLVSAYAKTSLELLLPELLSAMRDTLWRIRQAATRLLGDMLLVVAGAMPDRPDLFGSQDSAGNDKDLSDEDKDGEEGDDEEGEDDEDGNFTSPEEAAAAMTTEAAMKIIEEVLGSDRRNEVLAALYIVRCDVSVPVRQTAMQVWKSVVSNTPRVLREIMPTAVRQIVEGLGDEDEERRVASGKTLGDLAQKLGDRVVPEVLPALRTGITTKDNSLRIRKGACEGLGELVLACPKNQLEEHAKDLIDAIYQGLSDLSESVRAIAADVFSSLLRPLGTSAVDAVVPRLLEKLSDDSTQEETEVALDGLKQILRSSGTRLTSIIVPRLLTERPISMAASRVISTAAIVSESQFEPYVVDVMDCVVDSMETLHAEDSIEHLEVILAAVAGCGDVCLKQLLDELTNKFNEGYPDRRIATSRVCGAFCRAAHPDYVATAAITLLDTLIRQLADTDEESAGCSWKALVCLSESLPSAELAEHIPVIRQALRASSTGVVAEEKVIVLGLQVPKSPAPFVPLLTEALLQGAPELKEQAALCISELVELINVKSLGPFVIKLTGPLIRSLSGRVPWQVKAAVIRALHLLVKKNSALLRAFVPQLQSSFVKSLTDGNKMVRMRACAALSAVVPLQPRLEPLLNDLSSLGITGMSSGARSAAFRSCSQVFRLGKKLPESSFSKVADTILEGLADEDEDVWKSAGKCLGHLSSRAVDRDAYRNVLDKVHCRLGGEDLESSEKVSIIHAVGAVYLAAVDREDVEVDDLERSGEDLLQLMDSSFVEVRCATFTAVGHLSSVLSKLGERDLWARIVQQLGEKAEFDDKGEARTEALLALKQVVSDNFAAMLIIAQAIVVCAGETNTGIRDIADRVLRRAFVQHGVVDSDRLAQAKAMLEDEDARFLERKVGKVRVLPDSGDEKD